MTITELREYLEELETEGKGEYEVKDYEHIADYFEEESKLKKDDIQIHDDYEEAWI